MQQNLPNDFREAGLVFFPHPEEFQASSPQLGCRAAAAGGRVNRAGVGADGLCCLLGPDSGQLCPSRGLQLGEGCGDGRRPSPGSEPDRASAGARERRALLSPGASRSKVVLCTQEIRSVQAAGAARPRALPGARAWAQFLSTARLFLLSSAPCPFCHRFCGLSRETFFPKKPSVSPLASEQTSEAWSLISLRQLLSISPLIKESGFGSVVPYLPPAGP